MNSRKSLGWCLVAVAFLMLTLAGAKAQVSGINSAVVTTRVVNGVPAAGVSSFNFYPSTVLFSESNVGGSPGSAVNEDIWQFSSNAGVSAYQFQDFDFFNATNIVQLNGNPASPSKEAGFVFNTVNFGAIVFSVDSASHVIAVTGGFGSYNFSSLTYNSGDTIGLGFDYLKAPDGSPALQFFANGSASPVFEFSPGQDIGNGSTFGGFFQIQNDPSNPNNSGLAIFQNIGIVATPEPSSVAVLGVGLMALAAVSKLRRSF